MNCKDFQEIIDSYLCDELLIETNHDILRHLENCGNCRSEIEMRRYVRERLRTAVRGAPDLVISQQFSASLYSMLREPSEVSGRSLAFLSFGRSWTAVAAGLLVVLSFGFVFLGDGDPVSNSSVATSYQIPNLPADHLVNIATGDHEHCAIRHSLDESPVSLETASLTYRGLGSVVSNTLRTIGENFDLTESHACRYKDVRFAHLVFRNNGKLLSVLITDEGESNRLKSSGLLRFSSQKYRIASFDVSKRAVFVVSDLEIDSNSKVAEALFSPLSEHFAKEQIDRNIQTALLTVF